MKRAQIKREKHKLLLKEIYRKLRFNQELSKKNLDLLTTYDDQVTPTDSIKLRIEALREMNLILQERECDEEIQYLLQHMQNDESCERLLSKEYTKLEKLRAINEKEAAVQSKQVEQIKKEEDGHSKMPVQSLALLEEENNEKFIDE